MLVIRSTLTYPEDSTDVLDEDLNAKIMRMGNGILDFDVNIMVKDIFRTKQDVLNEQLRYIMTIFETFELFDGDIIGVGENNIIYGKNLRLEEYATRFIGNMGDVNSTRLINNNLFIGWISTTIMEIILP